MEKPHESHGIDWMSQQSGVTIVPGPANADDAVWQRKADVVLVVDRDFAKDFDQSKSADVKIYSDSTRRTVQPKLERVKSLLNRFSAETASVRLIVRGVAPWKTSTSPTHNSARRRFSM